MPRRAALGISGVADCRCYRRMNDSIETAVIAALKEAGFRFAPGALRCAFALCEGSVVARKFFCEGGYAIWIAAEGTISLYDDQGHLLRSLRSAPREIAA